MALGKKTTVKTILSNARVKTGTVTDGALTDAMLIDVLNFNVGEIAKKLRQQNHPFYIKSATLTLAAGVYSFSAVDPPVESVVKLVDASLGIIKFASADEYERFGSFSNLYANSLIAVVEGEGIRINKGSELGAHSTITLYYNKQLEVATAVGNYPDIPDSYTGLLTNMISADIYTYKTGGVRDQAKDAENQKSLEQFAGA